jgi:CheY-like chemotaxis protein
VQLAYDAAVIDHMMPGTDGLTLAQQIRRDLGSNGLRLILATSSNLEPTRRRQAEAVFDVILTKPVSLADLCHALISSAPHRVLAAPALSAVPDRYLRVLVADDTMSNQFVIRSMIEKLGHRADVVGNGREAVEAVKARPYDVVLMDVMMPEMDGVEATRLIRQLPPPRSLVPILGLTANVSPDDQDSYRAAGMDDVMNKPITRAVLEAGLASIGGGRKNTPSAPVAAT